jgi:hypothetical protein
VGCEQAGGIDRHLKETENAVLRWLEYENKLDQREGKPDDLLFALATEDIDKPEQPEILTLVRQMRNTGLAFWEGGLAAQPYLLNLEIQTCHNAEIAFRNQALANERLKLEWEAKKEDKVH